MKKYFLLAIISLFYFISNPQISKAATNYELNVKTLSGENFNLKKMSGKVVVVTFWAEWCPNCLNEMVALESLYKSYHQYGLEIIGVSVDPEKSLNKVKQRLSKVTYPNAMMNDAISLDFPEINSIPTTYIFDKSGALHSVIHSAGRLDKKLFEELLLSKTKTH